MNARNVLALAGGLFLFACVVALSDAGTGIGQAYPAAGIVQSLDCPSGPGVLVSTFKVSTDPATIHHYWTVGGETYYEAAKVRLVGGDWVEVRWEFPLEPGLAYKGTVAWKGIGGPPLSTPWESCK